MPLSEPPVVCTAGIAGCPGCFLWGPRQVQALLPARRHRFDPRNRAFSNIYFRHVHKTPVNWGPRRLITDIPVEPPIYYEYDMQYIK